MPPCPRSARTLRRAADRSTTSTSATRLATCSPSPTTTPARTQPATPCSTTPAQSIALTDGAGTVKDTWKYDPYGVVITHTGTDYNPFQYTSGYTDSATGLIHDGARYYNPNDGRFTQQDPAGQGPNLYAYAGENPTNYVDLSGLGFWQDLGGALAGTVAGAITLAGTVGEAGPLAVVGAGFVTGCVGAATTSILDGNSSQQAQASSCLEGGTIGAVVGGAGVILGALLL